MGRTRIERILRAVEGEYWALQPEKLQQIAELLCARAESGQIPTAAEVEAAEGRQRGQVRTAGAIAVIPLMGTLMKRADALDVMSGASSISTFVESFNRAVADHEVGAILLQVHSPGGSVYGIEEAFRTVYQARKKKRVTAILDSLGASAAYYIAAGADDVVVTPSGEGGSIGVWTVHFDHEEFLAQKGIKATILRYGEHKAEGHPYGPLSAEAAEHTQSIVDAYGRQFDSAVAKGRGVPVATVRDRFGQGRTFDSSRLVQLGMADRVATLEETIEDMQKGRGQRGSRAAVTVPADITGGTGHVDLPAAAGPESFSPELAKHLTSALRAVGLTAEALSEVSVQAVSVPSKSEEPSAAGGHAASDETPAPTEPAPEAREETVDQKDTGAPTKGLSAEDRQRAMEEARAEERERVRQIKGICEAHRIDASKADAWVAEGASVSTVQAAALEIIRARSEASPQVQVGATREGQKPFASWGEQLMAIYKAGPAGPSSPDAHPRLLELQKSAAASGANETVPSEGGFLVETDLAAGILEKMYDLGEVSSRVARLPVGPDKNGTKIRAMDESSRVDGSRWGGVQAYWAAEADTVTATKPKWRTMELNLHKLMGLMYATEEMLQDAAVLGGVAERVFPQEINFKFEDGVFRGTGAGQLLGFLNSPCLVTVNAESSQAAATIVTENILKMNARLWPRSRRNAVWFINVDTEPQLYSLTLGSGTAVVRLYTPPGTQGNEFGMLLGKPVIPVEYASTLGTVGDVALVDLNEYVTIDKGGVNQAWSVHVRFIYDEQTFKVTYRCDGQPAWNKPLTPYQGSNTQSPFVVLATRN